MLHVCLCKPDLPAGDGCDPRQLCWKTLLHSEGLGKGAWETPRLSLGAGGTAWAAELVLGWAVSSDGTLGFTVLSASSLSQGRAGSPAPHPHITAQAAQQTPISSTNRYIS